MGFIRRVVTPRPAKKAIRAVQRPAKTARQVITPTPAKKVASRAWRAAEPSVGIRQEVEGRAVTDTRRKLHSPGRPAGPAPQVHMQEVGFDETVAIMTRAGWTPEETSVEIVPVLSEIKPFLVLESERLDAVRELKRATGDEAELEALLLVNALRTAEMKLLAEIGHEVATKPFDEEAARFWSWVHAWRDHEKIEVDRRCDQQEAVVARMDPGAAKVIGQRAQQRLDQAVQRADG